MKVSTSLIAVPVLDSRLTSSMEEAPNMNPRAITDMIETHAEQLTNRLVAHLKTDPKTVQYRDLTDDELARRTYDVLTHLGAWLGEMSDDRIKERYVDLGRQRRAEEISLSQVIAALTLSRNHLWNYAKSEGLFESALDLYQEIEFLDLILKFFDKAAYYTAVGYEEADA